MLLVLSLFSRLWPNPREAPHSPIEMPGDKNRTKSKLYPQNMLKYFQGSGILLSKASY